MQLDGSWIVHIHEEGDEVIFWNPILEREPEKWLHYILGYPNLDYPNPRLLSEPSFIIWTHKSL